MVNELNIFIFYCYRIKCFRGALRLNCRRWFHVHDSESRRQNQRHLFELALYGFVWFLDLVGSN